MKRLKGSGEREARKRGRRTRRVTGKSHGRYEGTVGKRDGPYDRRFYRRTGRRRWDVGKKIVEDESVQKGPARVDFDVGGGI